MYALESLVEPEQGALQQFHSQRYHCVLPIMVPGTLITHPTSRVLFSHHAEGKGIPTVFTHIFWRACTWRWSLPPTLQSFKLLYPDTTAVHRQAPAVMTNENHRESNFIKKHSLRGKLFDDD